MFIRRTITIILLATALCCQAPMHSNSAKKQDKKANINELIDQLAASDTCGAYKAFIGIYKEGDQAIPILLAFGNDRTPCHLRIPQSKYLSVISFEHTRGILCLYLIESIRLHKPVHGGCYPSKKYKSGAPNSVRESLKSQRRDIQQVTLKAYTEWYETFKSGKANEGPDISWDGASGLSSEKAEKEMFLFNCGKDNKK